MYSLTTENLRLPPTNFKPLALTPTTKKPPPIQANLMRTYNSPEVSAINK